LIQSPQALARNVSRFWKLLNRSEPEEFALHAGTLHPVSLAHIAPTVCLRPIMPDGRLHATKFSNPVGTNDGCQIQITEDGVYSVNYTVQGELPAGGLMYGAFWWIGASANYVLVHNWGSSGNILELVTAKYAFDAKAGDKFRVNTTNAWTGSLWANVSAVLHQVA